MESSKKKFCTNWLLDHEIIMPSDDDQSATPPGQSIYPPEQSISTPEASVTVEVQEHETAFDDDPNEDRQNREYTNVSMQPFKAAQPTSKTFSEIGDSPGCPRNRHRRNSTSSRSNSTKSCFMILQRKLRCWEKKQTIYKLLRRKSSILVTYLQNRKIDITTVGPCLIWLAKYLIMISRMRRKCDNKK